MVVLAGRVVGCGQAVERIVDVVDGDRAGGMGVPLGVGVKVAVGVKVGVEVGAAVLVGIALVVGV